MTGKIITVFVNLLEEEIDVMRPTQAIILGNGQYKLLPIENYEMAEEVWEFEPGEIVFLKEVKTSDGGIVMVATK